MNGFNINSCKFSFTSDKLDLIALLYDQSGSMDNNVRPMREANIAFYKNFNKFEDKDSVAISKAVFNDYFSMTSFDSIETFDTSYYADGGTELYAAIELTIKNILEYYNEIQSRLNIRPKITFLVFTDGEDNGRRSPHEAKRLIAELNALDATTVFVAFDNAVGSNLGAKLGFTCTKDITTVQELVSTLGTQLSQSCKEQSKSAYSLKSAFFSQAAENANEDTTEDASLNDDEFFNA